MASSAIAAATTRLKVFGVPLSPPFRSVVWTLLQQRTPFQIQITVPGATTKIGSQHESFLNLTKGRTGVVPVLQIDGTAAIAESPAILTYLCETQPGWQQALYAPSGTLEKAQIDSYMHWHHSNTRQIAALTMPYTRPELDLTVSPEQRERAQNVLSLLDQAWLGSNDSEYLAVSDRCTIADLLAYEEIAQASLTGVVTVTDESHPNLTAWCRRMEARDFYEEAHRSLLTLGSLTDHNDTPMMKRLGAATKEGMKAIQEAQAAYSN